MRMMKIASLIFLFKIDSFNSSKTAMIDFLVQAIYITFLNIFIGIVSHQYIKQYLYWRYNLGQEY